MASAEVARLLVEVAPGDSEGDLELAGPQRENLVDLVRRLVELRGETVSIEPVSAPASMSGGSLLPGRSALIRGVDWETWARRATRAAFG